MTDFVWVDLDVVRAIHDQQLAEHGGAQGTRDEGLLRSALARPRHTAAYGHPDIADLAAAYACGLAGNHPFVDGNKRVSAVVTELFLDLNGYDLDADDADLAATWMQLAAGNLSESVLAAWIRARIVPRRA